MASCSVTLCCHGGIIRIIQQCTYGRLPDVRMLRAAVSSTSGSKKHFWFEKVYASLFQTVWCRLGPILFHVGRYFGVKRNIFVAESGIFGENSCFQKDELSKCILDRTWPNLGDKSRPATAPNRSTFDPQNDQQLQEC